MKKKLLFIVVFVVSVIAFVGVTERAWPVNDTPSGDIDLIVPLSYGTFKNRLTKATMETDRIAIVLRTRHPNANLAFAVFAHSISPEKEWRERATDLGTGAIYAGPVSSTITEAEVIRRRLRQEPKSIALVAGAYHSRSVRLVWERCFPATKIFVISTGWQNEIEKGQPIVFMRNRWTWLIANVARHVFLKLPYGFEMFKALGLRQPTNTSYSPPPSLSWERVFV